MTDFHAVLDALADLEGSRISVYIGGKDTGSPPVAVLRGIAGRLDMSRGWAGDDEVSSVAYLPIEPANEGGPFGPQGLYFDGKKFREGGGDSRVLNVWIADVQTQIVRETEQ